MSHKYSITLDAADPKMLGAFWATALRYVEEPPPAPYVTWQDAFESWKLPPEQWNDAYVLMDPEGTGARLFFQKVPEPKTVKNRMHFDVWVPGESRDNPASPAQKKEHAEFLVKHGASVLHEIDHPVMGFWVVMTDPEGNEFCVV